MRKASLALAFTLFCAFGAEPQSSPTNLRTWIGYVTDMQCGTHCKQVSPKVPDPNCVKLCVAKGSKYGLWSGNNVYMLEPQAKLVSFAAENVKVRGTLEGNTIQIVSVVPVSVRPKAATP